MMLATVVHVGDDLAIQFRAELNQRPGFEEGATVCLHTDGQRCLLSPSATPPAEYVVKSEAAERAEMPPAEGDTNVG